MYQHSTPPTANLPTATRPHFGEVLIDLQIVATTLDRIVRVLAPASEDYQPIARLISDVVIARQSVDDAAKALKGGGR